MFELNSEYIHPKNIFDEKLDCQAIPAHGWCFDVGKSLRFRMMRMPLHKVEPVKMWVVRASAFQPGTRLDEVFFIRFSGLCSGCQWNQCKRGQAVCWPKGFQELFLYIRLGLDSVLF